MQNNSQKNEDEAIDDILFAFENGELKKDELNLFDIRLLKEAERKTILIEEYEGIHGLVNSLMIFCTPYKKEVKLVAAYSFTNSVHRSADIEYNGEVMMRQNLKTLGKEDSEGTQEKEPIWHSIQLRGIFSFTTLKTLIQLFEERIKKKFTAETESDTEIIKIS